MDNELRADEENAAGMSHVRAGRIADAIPHFTRASELAPSDRLLSNNLAAALIACQRHEDALAHLDRLLSQDRTFAEAHHNRALALRGLGQLPESIVAAKEAVKLRRNYWEALTSLAVSLAITGAHEEARAVCRRALAINPRSAIALMTLGTLVAIGGSADRALKLLIQAISADPTLLGAYKHAGLLFRRLGRLNEAVDCFSQAAKLPDATAESYVWLGDTQAMRRERNAAIQSYGKALELDPTLALARAQRLYHLAWQCDWARIEEDAHLVPSLGVETDPVSPFSLLSLEDCPERHRVRSERFAESEFPRTAPLPSVRAQAKDRLRLGYFSSDFYGHATAYLTARLFELHDRSKFEVHAFSYGMNVRDATRDRLVRSFDAFHDVASMGDEAVARKAHEVGIDIAIDLKGYTQGSRLGILAYRPAPVQMTFLGYPGTVGAPFIDYLIADHHVIPPAERGNYAERLILLPHCYQPTDDQRPIAYPGTRLEAGLPEKGFVFASFNQSWKIGPREFACWCHLLSQVDGSVLWLLSSDPEAQRNLRNQLTLSGLAAERLVFAPFIPHERHLSRLQHADLVLDTFTYGAHTTASDALWAGVPLITCAGRGFATRVATSILHAVGLQELVTTSLEDYGALALRLAKDRQLLRKFRRRLASAKATAPLFDSEGYTRALEKGLIEAFNRAAAGGQPADIVVQPQMTGFGEAPAAPASIPPIR